MVHKRQYTSKDIILNEAQLIHKSHSKTYETINKLKNQVSMFFYLHFPYQNVACTGLNKNINKTVIIAKKTWIQNMNSKTQNLILQLSKLSYSN